MAMVWAGIDAGKTHHHCVAIDESGRRLLSRRVANDEPELLELLADVLALGDEVTWGIDLADDGGAALAITLLFNHDQPVHYISGRAIHRASESYRGEGKTDAKDAAVIADQARIRHDLQPLRTGDETVTDLKILTGRRTDLVADRTRTVNRLRAQLSGIFPGLERALHWADGLRSRGAEALATYEHPHFGRWPAATSHQHGAGRITYVGTVPDPAFAKALFRWAAPAGLWHPSHPSVTSTAATAREGRRVRFLHNLSWDQAEVVLPMAVRDVLTGTSYAAEQEVSLGSWDVKVLREDS